MSAKIVEQILTLRTEALLTIGMTLAAFVVMQLLIRRLDAHGGGSKAAALFVGLGGRSLFMLAAAWLKFAFLVSVLVLAQPAALTNYLLMAALCIFVFLLRPGLPSLLNELLGGGFLGAGVLISGTLLQFLRQIRDDRAVRAIYWLLAGFLILFAAGLLLREISILSGERKHFDEAGEIE